VLTSTGDIDQGHIVYYRANKNDCSICSLKPKCTTAVVRMGQVSATRWQLQPSRLCLRPGSHEISTRMYATASGRRPTPRPSSSHTASAKKIEMRFAHTKRIFRLDWLRLRGLSGAIAAADIGRQSFPCGAAHCAVRLYRPRAEIWARCKFPEAQAVN
jgi:hypothetical protein